MTASRVRCDWVVAAVLCPVLVASVAACGGPTRFGAAGVQSPPASSPSRADAGHNAADLRFLRAMVSHHQQAVDMAAMVDIRGGRPEVKQYASQIQRIQPAEIAQMSTLLRRWERELSPVARPPGDGMSPLSTTAPRPGGASTTPLSASSTAPPARTTVDVVTQGEMSGLARASGAVLDRMFLELMIRHHQRTIDLTVVGQRDGLNREVMRLAASIEAAHREELGSLRALLAES